MTAGDLNECECPDGCNGCERLDLGAVYQFLETQRRMWPKNSSEQWQIRAAQNMLGGIRDPSK